ncbi:MAG: hypothetical protein LKJ45_02495 [Oscillospiraceae bacterium]|nr:hypothetical protein [Oscillospiraceae bacterium]
MAAIENERIIPDVCTPLTEPIVPSAMAKHDYRNVKIAQNTTASIDLEKLKESMKKSFFQRLAMQVGR